MIRATLTQTNRFVLEKSFLVTNKAPSLEQLLRDTAGVPVEALWLSLKNRLPEVTVSQVEQSLQPEQRTILASTVRAVDHLINTADFLSLHIATARQRKQSFNGEFRTWGLDVPEVEQLSRLITDLVQQPLPEAEIGQQLPPTFSQPLTHTSRGGRVSQTTPIALILRWLIADGVLYHDMSPLSPSDAPYYAPLHHFYPNLTVHDDSLDEASTQTDLVRTYLATYGPATEADISAWTGLGKSETRRAVSNLAYETTLTMVDGIPGMLLMLKAQADQLQAMQPFTPPLILVLPANDPYLTAHRASRSRYVENPKLLRKLFNSSGESKPTIVINGRVVGLWNWSAENGLTWDLLVEVNPVIQPKLEAKLREASQLLSGLGGR